MYYRMVCFKDIINAHTSFSLKVMTTGGSTTISPCTVKPTTSELKTRVEASSIFLEKMA